MNLNALKRNQLLLRQKQELLAELELALSTTKGELRSFEIEYFSKIGSKYVQLDQLHATLDKLLAAKNPADFDANKKAEESEQKASKSAHDAEALIHGLKPPKKFRATLELKALYRVLAKLLHPDLTLDEKEKERRNLLMQEINEAYQAGDMQRLKEILDAERNAPVLNEGDNMDTPLVRLMRELAQIEKRIFELEKELESLRKTDLYILFEAATRELKNGNNLLQKISDDLQSQINLLQKQVDMAING